MNNLSNDIKNLLDKLEPSQLRWNEIEKALYPSYKSHYKSRKVFGVALSNNLTRLEDRHLIKREGMNYGSLNSRSPEPQPLANIQIEVRKAREEWINGDKASAWRRIMLLRNRVPQECQTIILKDLYRLYAGVISKTIETGVSLRTANRMIPRFLEELEALAVSSER